METDWEHIDKIVARQCLSEPGSNVILGKRIRLKPSKTSGVSYVAVDQHCTNSHAPFVSIWCGNPWSITGWGAGNRTKILVCKSWPARFTQMSQVDGTTRYKLDQPVLQKYKNAISDTSAHGDWRKLLRSATKLQILNCHHFLQTPLLQLAHWYQLNTQVLTS